MHISSHTLPCCYEGPPAYRAKAQYTLEMLLMPLGLVPRWGGRGALEGGGLYYGPAPEALPDDVLALPLSPEAPVYFQRREAYDPGRVRWTDWDGERWPVLFGRDGADDLVASAFFWLAGWQEHTTAARDRHGRFMHAGSLQARWGTTTRPAVDAYREVLAERLAACGVPLERRTWAGRAWACCPTHDVDYLHKWRPGILWREAVHYFILNHRREALPARIRRLRRALTDWLRPGDPCRTALERMPAEARSRGARATYFFKAGAHDPHDVDYRLETPYLRRQLRALLDDGFEVGLHPSYRAHNDEALLRAERDRLAAVLEEAEAPPPTSVRQHYLRYEAPTTAHLHARLGFRIDSTLGFAQHEGFRHATCLPFRLYDAEADVPLDVWEMPLAVMESTLFNRRDLDLRGACEATEIILRECRRFGGVAVLLWHNTLWDEMDYPGWGAHYLHTLDAARVGGALVTSLREALEKWKEGQSPQAPTELSNRT